MCMKKQPSKHILEIMLIMYLESVNVYRTYFVCIHKMYNVYKKFGWAYLDVHPVTTL